MEEHPESYESMDAMPEDTDPGLALPEDTDPGLDGKGFEEAHEFGEGEAAEFGDEFAAEEEEPYYDEGEGVDRGDAHEVEGDGGDDGAEDGMGESSENDTENEDEEEEFDDSKVANENDLTFVAEAIFADLPPPASMENAEPPSELPEGVDSMESTAVEGEPKPAAEVEPVKIEKEDKGDAQSVKSADWGPSDEEIDMKDAPSEKPSAEGDFPPYFFRIVDICFSFRSESR